VWYSGRIPTTGNYAIGYAVGYVKENPEKDSEIPEYPFGLASLFMAAAGAYVLTKRKAALRLT
jgi:hypothetical protein